MEKAVPTSNSSSSLNTTSKAGSSACPKQPAEKARPAQRSPAIAAAASTAEVAQQGSISQSRREQYPESLLYGASSIQFTPGATTEGRHLSEITGVLQRLSEKHPQQSPHWNKFASMKKEKEDGAHLGSLEWKEILVDVWNNVYDVHGNQDLRTRTPEPYDMETWQELLLHHGLQDVSGFGEYLKEWKE